MYQVFAHKNGEVHSKLGMFFLNRQCAISDPVFFLLKMLSKIGLAEYGFKANKKINFEKEITGGRRIWTCIHVMLSM